MQFSDNFEISLMEEMFVSDGKKAKLSKQYDFTNVKLYLSVDFSNTILESDTNIVFAKNTAITVKTLL